VSASVVYMSMSLDEYIAGPNDESGNPGGDGFDRLHGWFLTPEGGRPAVRPGRRTGRRMDATGAVLVGRRTVEQVDHWSDEHHGVPIFVPSHRPPGPSVANYLLVTHVTDGIVSATHRRWFLCPSGHHVASRPTSSRPSAARWSFLPVR
jgi:dihydrofolate reductase